MRAKPRKGVNTGPGRLRMIASSRPTMRMKDSATRKIWTLMRKARRIFGSAAANVSGSRNAARNSSQPGALTIRSAKMATTTTVLTMDTTTPRRPDSGSPRSRERRDPEGNVAPVGSAGPVIRVDDAPSSGEGWRVVQLADFAVVDRLPRAVGLDDRQRLVDAGGQRAVLLEHDAEIALHVRGDLAHDGAFRLRGVEVVDLRVTHVEGRRQVDHEPVDLAVPERPHAAQVVAIHLDLALGLDDGPDEVEARRGLRRAPPAGRA